MICKPKFKVGDLVHGSVDGVNFAGIVEHLIIDSEKEIRYGVRQEHRLGGYDEDVRECPESCLVPESRFMPKADPDSNVMPCVICGKEFGIASPCDSALNRQIERYGYDYSVVCHTPGNWGSQVHDDSGCLSFIICDGCIIKNSAKMLYRSYYDENGEKIQTTEETRLNQQNAREYFEEWYSRILERGAVGDSYCSRVGAYLED